MNNLVSKLLHAALTIGEEAASEVVPGGSMVIAGVHKLVDKDNHNNAEAIEQIGNGVIIAVNELKNDPSKVIDATLVTAGVLEVQSGLKKIRAGLK